MTIPQTTTSHILRIIVALVLVCAVGQGQTPVIAQEAPTPIVVELASPTPLPILGTGANATATPTPTPTETPIGPVQIEVAGGQENVNVRSDADPDSAVLGVIAPGERYAVTGRYFRWIQFRFPNSPNGLGFVYDELVQIIGDTSLIPDLTVVGTITTDPLLAAPPADDSGNTQSDDPAVAATMTSEARLLQGPVAVDPNSTPSETNLNPEGDVRLPTYTPAPNIGDLLSALNQPPTATPESDTLEEISRTASNLPPIAPILLIGGLGVLGFAISMVRRS